MNLNYKNSLLMNRQVSYTSSVGIYFLFILWPFLALIFALNNYKAKNSVRIVYLFLIYFGFTFVIMNKAMDSRGFSEMLIQTATRPFHDFWKIVSGFYSTDTSIDFIQPLFYFIVSRFTEDARFLTAFFAAFFGYFHLKSSNLLYQQYKIYKNPNSLIYLLFFICLIPIFQINGFRYWTASWLFFYGTIYSVYYNDKKYLLFSVLAAFVHFSFLSANIVLIAYLFLGNRNLIYSTLLLASFIIPEIFTSQVNQIGDYLGGGLQTKVTAYSNEDYSLTVKETENLAKWFMKLSWDLPFYFFTVAILFIKLKYNRYASETRMRNLFSFTILFLSFVNFGKTIPSGARFITVFYLFATAYILNFYSMQNSKRISTITWIGLFPMLLLSIVTLRVGLENTSVWLFMPSLFGILAEPISIASIFFQN